MQRLISYKAWMFVGLLTSTFDFKKRKNIQLVDKLTKLVMTFDSQSTTVKTATKSNFPFVSGLIKLCKATAVPHIVVAVIPARAIDKTRVQKFMPTNPRPTKPSRRRLDALTLKSSFSYAKLWLKILSEERKCPSKDEEDIYQMCRPIRT